MVTDTLFLPTINVVFRGFSYFTCSALFAYSLRVVMQNFFAKNFYKVLEDMCDSSRLTTDAEMFDLHAYIRDRHIAAIHQNIDSDSFNFKEIISNTIKGTVMVFARPTRYLGVVHHYIVLREANSNDWIVVEWDNEGLHQYRAKTVNGVRCLNLGEFSLIQVIRAVEASTRDQEYSFPRYNCNHWAENVAEQLGRPIKVHYNCATSNCIDPRLCHHADLKYSKMLRWVLNMQSNVLTRWLLNVYLANRQILDATPLSLCCHSTVLTNSAETLLTYSLDDMSQIFDMLLLAWLTAIFKI